MMGTPLHRIMTSIFYHYLFLENLLIECNLLIINTPQKTKQPKETNWKQKFQKPQNENICLTYLNTENKWNFHFLSFDNAIRVMLKVAKLNLIVDSAISFICCDSWRIICEKWVFGVAFYSIFWENTVEFVIFWDKKSFIS